MSNEILMLPPQITVGQSVIAVHAVELENGALRVDLRPAGEKNAAGNQLANRDFPVLELPQVLPWIEEQAQRIADAMQAQEKLRLRRQGYRV